MNDPCKQSFFDLLSDSAQRLVSAWLRPRVFDAGRELFAQGADAASALFIDEGEVAIGVRMPGGGVLDVATLTCGDAIGEFALIEKGTRSATARASSDVRGRELSREDFQAIVGHASPESVNLLRALAIRGAERIANTNERLIRATLDSDLDSHMRRAPSAAQGRASDFDPRPYMPHMPFFERFAAADLDAFLQRVQLVEYPRGCLLAAENDPPTWLGIVMRGAVELRAGAWAHSTREGLLGPGSPFGHVKQLRPGARASSWVAREDCVVARIEADVFHGWVGGEGPLAFRFAYALAASLIERLATLNRAVARAEQAGLAGYSVWHAERLLAP